MERYITIRDFVKEDFWYIKLVVKKPPLDGGSDIEVTFNWERDKLFDKAAVEALYSMAQIESNDTVRIKKIASTRKTKRKPVPLTTVALQKLGTSKLKMSSHDVMKIAEKLYTSGYISYPRTETDSFDKTIDLRKLINNLSDYSDEKVRNFIQNLSQNGFENPRSGGHNDQAHPPIHPVKLATNLSDQEYKIYNLISRHFLACCSKDAVGEETKVVACVGQEEFTCSGIVVTEKNYLEVYPYEVWSDKTLPKFMSGEEIKPSQFSIQQGQTTPPPLLTEADLIGMMEKNQIGTDSTIHEHIKTIQDRKYAFKQGMYFKPSNLGVSLVECYRSLNLKLDLTKPMLRSEMEKDMDKIAKGSLTKDAVVAKYQTLMADIYQEVSGKKSEFIKSLEKYININRNLDGEKADEENEEGGNNDDDNGDNPGGKDVFPMGPGEEPNQKRSKSEIQNNNKQGRNSSDPNSPKICSCPFCGNGNIVLKTTKAGSSFIACTGYPQCTASASLPNDVESAEITTTKCKNCSAPNNPFFKVKVSFKDKSNRASQQCLKCSEKFPGYSFNIRVKGGSNTAAPTANNNTNNSSTRVAPEQENTEYSRPAQKPAQKKSDMSGIVCFRCNQPGHYSTQCPNPPAADASNRSQVNQLVCNRCNQVGHLGHNCPQRPKTGDQDGQKKGARDYNPTETSTRTVTCYRCGKQGHVSSQCPDPPTSGGRDLSNVECFKCKQKGHYSSSCPNK